MWAAHYVIWFFDQELKPTTNPYRSKSGSEQAQVQPIILIHDKPERTDFWVDQIRV